MTESEKLAIEIFTWCLENNDDENFRVFFDFSGHVNQFGVRVCGERNLTPIHSFRVYTKGILANFESQKLEFDQLKSVKKNITSIRQVEKEELISQLKDQLAELEGSGGVTLNQLEWRQNRSDSDRQDVADVKPPKEFYREFNREVAIGLKNDN